MTSSSEITLTYNPNTGYRAFVKGTNIMTIFLGILFTFAVILLILAEYYLKSMYDELEILRIENVSLKLKLAELIGKLNDKA